MFNPGFDPLADVAYPLGFNIYRDNELIGFTSTGIFIDRGVSSGRHTYGIACLYEGNNESRISQTTVTTTATSIDGAADNGGTKVCADGNTIIVKSAADCLTSVYNAAGEPVTATVHVKAGTEKAFTIRQSGLYIVKAETSGNTTTHKIIIK